MAVVSKTEILALMLIGKLGHEGAEDPLNIFGIYRRRPTKNGFTLVKMPFYTPTNPRTEPQQAWRAIFTLGVEAWQALSEEAKDTYRENAKYKPLTGFNFFMREYLLTA